MTMDKFNCHPQLEDPGTWKKLHTCFFFSVDSKSDVHEARTTHWALG